MAFYDDMADLVTEMLGEFGKASVSIRTTATSSSDPAAGTVTQATPVDTAVAAIEVDFDERYQPGALIQASDRMYALDAAPNPEDMLIIDSAQWEIVQVWPKKPGDTFVAAFAQVRA